MYDSFNFSLLLSLEMKKFAYNSFFNKLMATAMLAIGWNAVFAGNIGLYVASGVQVSIAEGTEMVVYGDIIIEEEAKIVGKVKSKNEKPTSQVATSAKSAKHSIKSQNSARGEVQAFLDNTQDDWTGITKFKATPFARGSAQYHSNYSAYQAVVAQNFPFSTSSYLVEGVSLIARTRLTAQQFGIVQEGLRLTNHKGIFTNKAPPFPLKYSTLENRMKGLTSANVEYSEKFQPVFLFYNTQIPFNS